MSSTIAFIQARMSSSRFPGKVLEPILGVPSILYMTRRARVARRLDNVVVVTSIDTSDDPLVTMLVEAGVPVYRGDLHDVLKRYVGAANEYAADEVVRLTGDCPLIDPSIIDAVIDARRAGEADYASNIDPPTFPDGLDCECFTRAALERANAEATTDSEREHVTLWMRSAAARLRRASYSGLVDASRLRLTVDYPDDLAAVRRLVGLMPSPEFDFYDLLRVLVTNPDIIALNPHARNEKIAKPVGLTGQAIQEYSLYSYGDKP